MRLFEAVKVNVTANRKESDRVSETIYAGRYLDRIDSGVAGSYFKSSGLCATDL